VSFNITINNDDILEDDEQFILIINSSSLPDNVITDSNSRATVTIRNDDSKLIICFNCQNKIRAIM